MYISILLFFLSSCSHLFYQPSSEHFVNPAQFKLAYQDIYFNSSDKVKLHGWFFPAQNKKIKGTIVQFHGNAQNISTHFLSLYWLVSEGYNLFTFDYRGYAKSGGKPNQEGVHHDAIAAMNKALELHLSNGDGKFVIYGQSLGGAISLRAIKDWSEQDKIDLIVVDSSFSSYQEIAFDKLKSSILLFPLSPLAYVLVSDKFAPSKIIRELKNPTLVIVGDKDNIIPPKFGVEIYKSLQSKRKWIWKLPHGQHIDAFHHDNGSYRLRFINLLDNLSI